MAVLLDNPVRAYAWGSTTVIPELLGREPSGEPEAELWVGAHPGSPSTVVADGHTLDRYVAEDPTAVLGAPVVKRFGPRLPFLLKVLAVQRPLSLQVHPTIEQAVDGYDAEDSAGVPRESPLRSYHDRNHKPEMIVARTEFEALIGFDDPATGADLLAACRHTDLVGASAVLRGPNGLENLVRRWLTLPDDQAEELVAALTTEASERPAGGFGIVQRLAREYPGDRGLLLALLMRHVRLQPGEAVFVPAGVPHAYLSGVAIEPQASSDNTLRAGLTAKNVDVGEVLRLLRFEPDGGIVVRPRPGAAGERVYEVPGVDEFVLSEVTSSTADVPVNGPAVVLVVNGAATVHAARSDVPLQRGQAAFVPAADQDAKLSGNCVAYVLATGLR